MRNNSGGKNLEQLELVLLIRSHLGKLCNNINIYVIHYPKIPLMGIYPTNSQRLENLMCSDIYRGDICDSQKFGMYRMNNCGIFYIYTKCTVNILKYCTTVKMNTNKSHKKH